MNAKEFVANTILKFDDDIFARMREFFVNNGYISFAFCSLDSVSKEQFADKLCDYFEKVEIRNSKTFDKLIDKFITGLDFVIGFRVAKEQKPSKKNPVHFIPRARKYYDKACEIKKTRCHQSLVDYSRIMMCLYAEIIKTNGKEITEINYASECLNLESIVESMKAEQNRFQKTPKFNLKESLNEDTCSFVLLAVLYFYIKNNE